MEINDPVQGKWYTTVLDWPGPAVECWGKLGCWPRAPFMCSLSNESMKWTHYGFSVEIPFESVAKWRMKDPD